MPRGSGPRTRTRHGDLLPWSPHSGNSTIRNFLTQRPSFYVSIFCQLVLAVAVAAFVGTFVQQANRGSTRRWNIVIIVALIAGVVISSVFLLLGRIYHVRRVFASIPKPYIPIKAIDVPKEVAAHIMTEYNRTAVVAHLSQPTAAKQEGWGKPDTPFGGIHFRKRMRSHYTLILETLDSLLPPHLSSSPTLRPPHLPKDSFKHILSHPMLPSASLPLMDKFLEKVEQARYARSEPNGKEFENCVKIVAVLLGILENHRATLPPTTPHPSEVHLARLRAYSVHAPPPIFQHLSKSPTTAHEPATAQKRHGDGEGGDSDSTVDRQFAGSGGGRSRGRGLGGGERERERYRDDNRSVVSSVMSESSSIEETLRRRRSRPA